MKDYQQRRLKSYVLPEPVYRQALWAVKDLRRMKNQKEILEEMITQGMSADTEKINTGQGAMADRTGKQAVQLAQLSMRIEAIEGALEAVPVQYGKAILNKLAYEKPFPDDYHLNTWKKWQQVYLYHVAEALHLY